MDIIYTKTWEFGQGLNIYKKKIHGFISRFYSGPFYKYDSVAKLIERWPVTRATRVQFPAPAHIKILLFFCS